MQENAGLNPLYFPNSAFKLIASHYQDKKNGYNSLSLKYL